MKYALLALLAVVSAVLIYMVGFIGYRDFENNERCELALGNHATWSGGGDCQPPPVHVDGLL